MCFIKSDLFAGENHGFWQVCLWNRTYAGRFAESTIPWTTPDSKVATQKFLGIIIWLLASVRNRILDLSEHPFSHHHFMLWMAVDGVIGWVGDSSTGRFFRKVFRFFGIRPLLPGGWLLVFKKELSIISQVAVYSSGVGLAAGPGINDFNIIRSVYLHLFSIQNIFKDQYELYIKVKMMSFVNVSIATCCKSIGISILKAIIAKKPTLVHPIQC
jgi:hypothetical protein